MFGFGGAVFLFAFLTDMSERFWEFTRLFETWEFDELVAASIAMLIAGLVVALRRISALESEVGELKKGKQVDETRLSITGDDNLDFVVTCVSCGKHQVHSDQWFSSEELHARIREPGLLGGVCPTCQLPSED